MSTSSTFDMAAAGGVGLMRQRYSLAAHPSLPALVCSDGYLCAVLQIGAAHATHTRLIREMLNDTMSALNEASRSLGQPLLSAAALGHTLSNENNVDDHEVDKRRTVAWSLLPDDGHDDNDNNDVNEDSDDELPPPQSRHSHAKCVEPEAKISAGKIIFTFMHQVLPISLETMPGGGAATGSVGAQLATALGHVQSCWTMLLSLPPPLLLEQSSSNMSPPKTTTATTTSLPNANECEQACHTVLNNSNLTVT
jgi:hypothetical protein